MAGIPGFGGPSAQTRQYQNQTEGAYGAIRDTGTALSLMGRQAQGRYNTYRPQTDAALGNLTGLLQRRASDQDRAGVMSSALGDMAGNYQAGQSALQKQLQMRGLSADSSAGVGGMAALEGMRSGAMGGAAIAARQYGQDRQRADAEALYRLLYGEAEGANANASQYYGQGAGMMGQAAQGYGNLAQMSAQQDAARQQQIMSLIGTAAGAYGMMNGQQQPTAPTYGGTGRIANVPQFNASAGYDHSYGLPTGVPDFVPTQQAIPVQTPGARVPDYRQFNYGGRI